MNKKVTLKASRALHKVSTEMKEMKLNLGASVNRGDYLDTSIIKIGP
jgi:hypothetical protein